METENQDSQPSNAKMFGIIVIIFIVILVIMFGVDFGGDSSSANTNTTSTQQGDAQPIAGNKYKEGKDLFKSNCAACHNVRTDGTGPALTGAKARWNAAGEYQDKTGEQWLHAWVKNWSDPVNAGYKYAADMANTRASTMNSFPYLSDDDIDQIFLYIDSGFVTAAK